MFLFLFLGRFQFVGVAYIASRGVTRGTRTKDRRVPGTDCVEVDRRPGLQLGKLCPGVDMHSLDVKRYRSAYQSVSLIIHISARG